MNCRYNLRVPGEVRAIQRHYREEAGPEIAEEFFEELLQVLGRAADDPERFHVCPGSDGARRANLDRFPYHFIYRIHRAHIYVLVVRHHKRHPSFGLKRK